MKIFTVNQNDANQRLDKFIQKLMPSLPKTLLYKGIRKNNVRVNGKHCHDGSLIICENDEIKLYFGDEFFNTSATHIPRLPEPTIVYEDENILVADKPKGLSSHSDEKNSNDTMIDRIISYLFYKGEFNPEIENTFAPALCNRLDRNTSGLVIAAKNANSLRIINQKIKDREINKFYICRCDGKPPKSKDTIYSHLTRGNKKVFLNDEGSGKEIITEYKVIKSNDTSSLLEIKLLTGRTHQIRAHLASIGNPLSGDVKYGGTKQKGGYFLKSYKLAFNFTTPAYELDYLKGTEIKCKI